MVVQQLAPAGIKLAADWVRNRPVEAEPPQTPEGAAHLPDGCPCCQLHADMAEARALLEGMALKAGPDGAVPGHIAATVVLVDQRLRLADDKLSVIGSERPDLAGDTDRLRKRVAAARSGLPARAAVDRWSAERARVEVEGCWRESVDLADAYFAPRPLTERDKVLEWVRSLSPEERRQLLEAAGR